MPLRNPPIPTPRIAAGGTKTRPAKRVHANGFFLSREATAATIPHNTPGTIYSRTATKKSKSKKSMNEVKMAVFLLGWAVLTVNEPHL